MLMTATTHADVWQRERGAAQKALAHLQHTTIKATNRQPVYNSPSLRCSHSTVITTNPSSFEHWGSSRHGSGVCETTYNLLENS
jgi:hypothetical protein